MILLDRETVLRDYDGGVFDLKALYALLPTVHDAMAPLVLKLADGSVAIAAAPSMLYGVKPRQGRVQLDGGASLVAEDGKLLVEGLPLSGDIPSGLLQGGTVEVTQCHIGELEVTGRLTVMLASGVWEAESVHADHISASSLALGGELECSALEVPGEYGSVSAQHIAIRQEAVNVPAVNMNVIETAATRRRHPCPRLAVAGKGRNIRFYMKGAYGAAPKARLRVKIPVLAAASVLDPSTKVAAVSVLGPSTEVALSPEPQLVPAPEMLDTLLIYPYFDIAVTESSSAIYEATYTIMMGSDPNTYERVLVSNPTDSDIEKVPHAWAFSGGRDSEATVTVLATVTLPARSTCEFLFACNASTGTACMYPTGEAVRYA